ncbi:MAG: ligand-binding sensor domain-containing protein [Breznakibacter sp.]
MRNITLKINHHYSIGTLAIWLWFVLGINAQSQINWHNTSLFNTSNGLSNNNITALFSDSKGLLWIGTEDGLTRYDGYSFVLYRHNNTDSTSITGNMIRAIDETPDGNLWIATVEHGLCVWQRSNNKFICINNNKNNKAALPEIEIQGIKVIKDQVFVKTRNYLSIIESQSLKVESFPIIENLIKKYDYGKAALNPLDNSKQLVIGGADGCHLFDMVSRKFIKTPPQLNYYGSINHLCQYKGHLVMSTNKGLAIYNDAKQLVSFHKSKNVEQEYLGMSPATNGSLWIAGTNGVERLDSIGGQPTTIIADLSAIQGMGSYRVNCIYEDPNQNLWLGTRHNGLVRIDLKQPKFSALEFATNVSLPADVKDMSFAADGSLLFAAGTRGVAIAERIWPTSKENKLNYISVFGKEATTLLTRRDGSAWVGTNEGIYLLNRERNKLSEFDYAQEKEFANLIGLNNINDLMEDRLGNIWIATSFGLYKYNGQKINSYFCDQYSQDGLCNDWVNVVFEDEQGWIWVGTNEGLRYLIPGEKEFVSVRNTPKEHGILSNNHVLSFCQVSNHEILIGTRSGITCFSKNNNAFSVFTNNSQLNNDVINSILIDGQKQIWIGTNNGVTMINPSNHIFNFHQRDGLRNAYFNRGAIAQNDGLIYFGGLHGIDHISPAVIPANKTKPRLIISSINIEYSNGEKSFLQESQNQLTIRYKRNAMVSIDFSSLDFTLPQRCQYKVFMEGYDTEWSAPTNKNNITYFDLPAGEYVLNILASNSDLMWNEAPLQLTLNIIPPLWRTKYAYAFYFLMVVILLHVVSNYRVFKIKRAYRELEEKSNSKRMLEDQRDKLARVHQSLKDSIGYAKRIQEAMIPSEERVRVLFPESFVYFRPKDIVSGDFYWTFENEEKQILVAADCTGHGVPGAFMSIIGLDLIKNAVEQQMVCDPATILSILNKGIHATFTAKNNNETDGFNLNDGMDIAICVIDKATHVLSFAGGMSSIYLIRDNEIFSYKGDRKPIGSVASNGSSLYEKQEIQLLNNDFIYLFSDGYADQFGGPEGKKFKYRRFRHLLLNIHKLPAEDQKNIIHQKFEEWIGTKYEQVDDVLVMGFSYLDENTQA